jgi:hypothetical protein
MLDLRKTCKKQIHVPRRVQHQVDEGFGFEVSLDAVVLFDDRDQCRNIQ